MNETYSEVFEASDIVRELLEAVVVEVEEADVGEVGELTATTQRGQLVILNSQCFAAPAVCVVLNSKLSD